MGTYLKGSDGNWRAERSYYGGKTRWKLIQFRMWLARILRLHECLSCKANLATGGGNYSCEFHKAEWLRKHS